MLSSLLSVLVFAGMQMFSKQLGSTEWFTILGGFLGSVLFICSLTVSYFELNTKISFYILRSCLILYNYSSADYSAHIAKVFLSALYRHSIIWKTCFLGRDSKPKSSQKVSTTFFIAMNESLANLDYQYLITSSWHSNALLVCDFK